MGFDKLLQSIIIYSTDKYFVSQKYLRFIVEF